MLHQNFFNRLIDLSKISQIYLVLLNFITILKFSTTYFLFIHFMYAFLYSKSLFFQLILFCYRIYQQLAPSKRYLILGKELFQLNLFSLTHFNNILFSKITKTFNVKVHIFIILKIEQQLNYKIFKLVNLNRLTKLKPFLQ